MEGRERRWNIPPHIHTKYKYEFIEVNKYKEGRELQYTRETINVDVSHKYTSSPDYEVFYKLRSTFAFFLRHQDHYIIISLIPSTY